MPLVIFDLDGTLIDSRLDLAHAVNATRAETGRGPLAHELVFSYVGNGAPVLIRRAMGPEASDEEVKAALEFFPRLLPQARRRSYGTLPGSGRIDRASARAGVPMAVLTNKPVRITKSILDHFGLLSSMLAVYGGNSFDHKKPHPIGIETLRAEACAGPEETWMVGDSYVDVQTARNAGVSACGVTYGFQPETFREFPPDLLVDSSRGLHRALRLNCVLRLFRSRAFVGCAYYAG
ncbi:MAG TPA: HAD-IA family hydrolase [Bryobacteraceae bacterium]|nr:HAD-IA family hydrolase [Bryobacteraceae bacterium]